MLSSFKLFLKYFRNKFFITKNDSFNINQDLRVCYKKENKKYYIDNKEINIDQKKVFRRAIMGTLKDRFPEHSIQIDDIYVDYYDRCLERYLYERFNRNIENHKTCWFNLAQNNKCIGWFDNSKVFDLSARKNMLDKVYEGKNLNFTDDDAKSLEIREDGFVFFKSNTKFDKDYKITGLFESISKSRFKNYISALSPIIIGYSSLTRKHVIISGRHRVASLKYLRSIGKIKNIKLRCHFVEYHIEKLDNSIPYFENCLKCDWSGVMDPGVGSHQDFYLRDGIPILRGAKNVKGGRQKWEVMQEVFCDAVQGKRVLDVGAHKGMYCFLALQYGASFVTALEPTDRVYTIMEKAKEKYQFKDFNFINGDFYDQNVFKQLQEENYDTVFFLGIIHHLLRIGIQRKILYDFNELLEMISKIVNQGVIIEFSLPTEKSLSLPELEPYVDNFSQSKFELALKKYFPNYKNLGHCKYKSGNRHKRYMYYAKKN